MSVWAATLGLGESEIIRWTAAGHLHDALKDAPEVDLAPLTDAGWPGVLLHGPACAARLREDGVRDEELLLAVTHHSTGHPEFKSLGSFLYMADFLDPGRRFLSAVRQDLRDRLPRESDAVLLEVLRHRITSLLDHRQPVLPVSLLLWNRVAAS